MNGNEKRDYVGYEYKEVSVRTEDASLYLDCYENFGWAADPNFASVYGTHLTRLRLKRNRKIANKMELTRLQQHFEACAGEIEKLEQAKTAPAMIWALTAGILGTAFMARATFAAGPAE